jgi:hypothetical protein
MTHYSDDELALYFYGEASRAEKMRDHLDRCAGCAASYAELAATLKLVTAPEAPERDERYGLEVWQRIRPQLPVTPPAVLPLWRRRAWSMAALTAAAAILIVLVSGRGWLQTTMVVYAPATIAGSTAAMNGNEAARVRRAAIGDHLEQSERLLLDFANADGRQIDVSRQQAWADNLLQSNRLYRDAASLAGDNGVAQVLDDLERSLLDIANGPSTLTPADHDRMRSRVDTSTLLFKLRVLSGSMHEPDTAPVTTRNVI